MSIQEIESELHEGSNVPFAFNKKNPYLGCTMVPLNVGSTSIQVDPTTFSYTALRYALYFAIRA